MQRASGRELKDGCRAAAADEAARGDSAMDGQNRALGVEEVDVEVEPHAEGVDRGAVRDQEARTGRGAIEQGQTEEPRPEADRDRDLAIQDSPPRQPARASGQMVARGRPRALTFESREAPIEP